MYLVTFIDDSNYYASTYALGIYETEDKANAAITTEKNKYLKNKNHVMFRITSLNVDETNSIEYNKVLSCYKNDLKLS